jgi:hypothetical protein
VSLIFWSGSLCCCMCRDSKKISIVKLGLSNCYCFSAFSIALLGDEGYLGSSGFDLCMSFSINARFVLYFIK